MTDESFLDELGQVAATQENTNTPSSTPSIENQRRKRPTSKASTSSSVTPSPTPSNAKETAIDMLHSLQQRAQSLQSDHFSAFGDLIAGRLRKLSAEQAEEMEMALTQTMYNCLRRFRATTSSLTAAQMDAPTTPSAQSSHIIRPKTLRTLGLPQPPRNRDRPVLKEPENVSPGAFSSYSLTRTYFPDDDDDFEESVNTIIEIENDDDHEE